MKQAGKWVYGASHVAFPVIRVSQLISCGVVLWFCRVILYELKGFADRDKVGKQSFKRNAEVAGAGIAVGLLVSVCCHSSMHVLMLTLPSLKHQPFPFVKRTLIRPGVGPDCRCWNHAPGWEAGPTSAPSQGWSRNVVMRASCLGLRVWRRAVSPCGLSMGRKECC